MKARRNTALPTELISAVFIAFIICPYMLSIPFDGYSKITAWKYKWFLFGCLAYMGAMIICCAFNAANAKHRAHIRFNNHNNKCFELFLLIYVLSTTVSALFSIYQGVWIGNSRYDGALTVGFYGIVALLISRYLRPHEWMLLLFGATLSLLCVIGIIQFFGANPFNLYPDNLDYYDAGTLYASQYWGTIGNTDLCAAILSLSIGLFIAALSRKSSTRVWLYSIPLFLCVFCMVELNVEAGLFALLVGLVLLPAILVTDVKSLTRLIASYGIVFAGVAFAKLIVFFDGGAYCQASNSSLALLLTSAILLVIGVVLTRSNRFEASCVPKIRNVMIIASLLMVIGALAVVYFAPSLPSGYLAQAQQILHGNVDDSFGSSRIYIWKQVWQAILKRPFLGGGPDTLSLRGLDGFSRYSPELGITIITTIDAAHNELLNIWANQGIFALLSYFCILVYTLIRWWRGIQDDSTAFCGAAVLFYLIQSLFGISFCSTSIYLWVAIGIVNTAPTACKTKSR